MPVLHKLKAGLRKPLPVVAFRLRQELTLLGRWKLGFWPRLAAGAQRRFDSDAVGRCLEDPVLALLDRNGLGELKAAGAHASSRASITDYADTVLAGRFSVFGSTVPAHQVAEDWWRDWRFNKVWAPAYFEQYRFYESRAEPYDVKFPWEASRLQCLQPVLLSACLSGENRFATFTHQLLQSWYSANPVARSVVWYPMEASIRVFTLVFLLDLVKLLEPSTPYRSEIAGLLLRMLVEHGEFVWATREYTDIRGNHYAANIGALAAVGSALWSAYPRARRWLRFAKAELDREALEQFLPDGVNIEKSIPYHALVTELFLLGGVAVSRRAEPFSDAAWNRVKAASRFLGAVRRPDGLCPNWGDNDDGRLLAFEPLSTRDHGALLHAAAVILDDARLAPASAAGRASALAFGRAVAAPMATASSRTEHFQDGGFIRIADGERYLLVDVGEIGLCGRGGHGHLDLLSFEYCLGNSNVVIDPGCPTYTGDLGKRNAFRSGFSHNLLLIEQRDIGKLVGAWGVANAPLPRDISIDQDASNLVIRGSHNGYDDLSCLRRYHRRFELPEGTDELTCFDELEVSQPCSTERFFFLGEQVVPLLLERNHCDVKIGARTLRISWNPEASASCGEATVSPGYGQERRSHKLTLRDRISGSAGLWLSIKGLQVDA